MGRTLSATTRLADVVRGTQSVRRRAVVPDVLHAAAPGIAFRDTTRRTRPVRRKAAAPHLQHAVPLPVLRRGTPQSDRRMVDARRARAVRAHGVAALKGGKRASR